ncbi:MAG TPA: hypothetical protein VK863_00325 [Candidatus Limnocylindrales bacterium]|nr:hypothetical protein [Candidatus Limnocylindrales bacterium]
MLQPGKNDPIGDLERGLAQRGVACIRERFRVPAFPQVSPCAGFLLGSTGAFLLAAGSPAASFLVGISGALLLVLSACGFTPLDWLGPKEKRSVLVVPGTSSEEKRKALFLAIPLFCRFTPSGYYSREEAGRRILGAFGFLLAIALPFLAGAVTLRYFPPLPWTGALAGAAMGVVAAGVWVQGKPAALPRNLAADWVGRTVQATAAGSCPFLLVYTGDEAEVKFFLAKYRRALFRGRGVFVEFSEGSCGPPAVSVREGPFFLPYRVDAGLFSNIRAAGEACGIHSARMPTLRLVSGGLAAMSRGFKAVTLFRTEAPSGGEPGLSDESALAWLAEIADGNDLTGRRKGV